MKKIFWVLFAMMLVLLTSGCGEVDSAGGSGVQKEPEDAIGTNDKPPALMLTIGGEKIRTARTSYSWGYYDEEEGSMAGVEASTDSPPALIDTAYAKTAAADAEVQLDFEEAPSKYEIQAWDEENNVIASYDELDLSQHQGMVIFEIRAYWEQGSAGYAFALDIE